MRSTYRRTSRSRVALLGAWIGAGALALAACGGSDDTGGTTAPPTPMRAKSEVTDPPTESSDAPTTKVETSGAITEVSEAKHAVVQVLAEGSFRDPIFGMQGFAGAGSGFIIDPAGIVVTNNHVVTGAGIIEVRIGGSSDRIPARILGVSECNDLAVLELIDPGPYPYLDWHTGSVTPPLEVYAAGFPLGDPEYTVTRGVVSKERADGESSWASVRHVIEHDANIQPGNSGGPLVGADGRVVGVNYAADDWGTGTLQYFAIAADLAAPVVEQLRRGNDETIGVNGQAIVDADVAGIWVAGVAPGSPASETGVLPGDVITTLNGVPLDSGTMSQYCSVLRSATPGAPMAIQVLRFDTSEVWEGEINGRPMSLRFSFADTFADDVAPVDPGAPSDPVLTAGYEWVTDDTGTITVKLPVAWGERDTAPTDLGLPSGLTPTIIAAPDLAAFSSLYTVPGMMFFGSLDDGWEFGIEDTLDELAPFDAACEFDGRSDYQDAVFGGQMDAWFCDGTLYFAIVAKVISDSDAIAIIVVQASTEAHLEALDEILWTFNFNW